MSFSLSFSFASTNLERFVVLFVVKLHMKISEQNKKKEKERSRKRKMHVDVSQEK